jgi:hypothetical protein
MSLPGRLQPVIMIADRSARVGDLADQHYRNPYMDGPGADASSNWNPQPHRMDRRGSDLSINSCVSMDRTENAIPLIYRVTHESILGELASVRGIDAGQANLVLRTL